MGSLSTWDKNIFELIWQSGFFAKVILLTLLALSVISWMITLNKARQYRGLLHRFKQLFGQDADGTGGNLRELFGDIKSPIGRIYSHGDRVMKAAARLRSVQAGGQFDAAELKYELESAAEEEASQFSSGLPFLGTVITVSPFLGLLGTVWGVMQSFISIGASGNADLSTLAPGIAEALITTIAGLTVAIPAVFCYNYLNARLKRIEDGLYRLSGELTFYFAKRWEHEKTKS